MKNMKCKLTALFAAAAMALSLAGCGSAASSTASATSGSGQNADYTVGILQYTSHSSLDEIAAAIQSELEQQAQAAGVTINVELKNGQGDAATINDICKMFVSDQVDLIIPIATPAATVAAAAVQGTDIPLVYSAVTDPVTAQLAKSMEEPGENMTGTSDYIDTAKILDLVENSSSKKAKADVKDQLEVIESAMREGCIGQLPEIYDGENPTRSKGCFAQAWSVGEILRVYAVIEKREGE